VRTVALPRRISTDFKRSTNLDPAGYNWALSRWLFFLAPKTKRSAHLIPSRKTLSLDVFRRLARWTVAVLASGGWCAAGEGARADELIRAARELHASYVAQLGELAAWCDQQGLAEQARITRQWMGQRDPNKLYVADLPRAIGRPELPPDTPANVVEWDRRFWQLRRQQAKQLEALARRAVRADRASLAFDLAMGAIREDPDFESIRRLLGYQKFRNGWYTLYEVEKLKSGQVWHDQFGWLPAKYLRRYQQGERWTPKGWASAEEDARLRRDITVGWDVETEHYAIRTNHSLEGGVQLGVKLEQLFRVWRELFIRYYATPAQVADLFDGRSRKKPTPFPRLQVVYFRDRDDYVRGLPILFPQLKKEVVGMSEGVYIADAKRAFFFASKEQNDRTVYHEATHQLFHQTRPVANDVGMRANFWIVEGIAMYMETLRREDGFLVLGGFDDARILAARYRLLNDRFYVPLAEFAALSLQKLQGDPRIATLYSQAAGLTQFLVHYDGGRYRDALVAYLSAVYSGADSPTLLSKLTGTSFAELDKQYREYIESAGPVVLPTAQEPAEK